MEFIGDVWFLMIVMFFITHPFTVFFHEMGHAVPALLFTKGTVTVYLGSYGDPARSSKIKIGRLELWVQHSIFWSRGLCLAPTDMAGYKGYLFIVGGPIASVLIAIVSAYIIFNYDMHGSLKFFIAWFFLFAAIDFFVNVIPSQQPLRLQNGKIVYNDGYQLRKRMYGQFRYYKEWEKAANFYNAGDFARSYHIFDYMVKVGIQNAETYRWAFYSAMLDKDYYHAYDHFEGMKTMPGMTADDYTNGAFVMIYLDMIDKAYEEFKEAGELAPSRDALANCAFSLLLLDRAEEAIASFDILIGTDSTDAYAYANRGLAKIKMNYADEGLADINLALTLDPGSAYGLRSLGVYHMMQNNKQEALACFVKARYINVTTHKIDELIKEASK